jgi:hypothetical protein
LLDNTTTPTTFAGQSNHTYNLCWTIQPHLQPLLDKQVILEETISQLQDGNTKLRTKMELIDMRLEEQEQYSGRTSLRFHNVRVPTDLKGNII